MTVLSLSLLFEKKFRHLRHPRNSGCQTFKKTIQKNCYVVCNIILDHYLHHRRGRLEMDSILFDVWPQTFVISFGYHLTMSVPLSSHIIASQLGRLLL